MDQPTRPARADQRTRGHHHVAAVAIDRRADERRGKAGGEQAEREAAHARR